jgi:hypothetical protein
MLLPVSEEKCNVIALEIVAEWHAEYVERE